LGGRRIGSGCRTPGVRATTPIYAIASPQQAGFRRRRGAGKQIADSGEHVVDQQQSPPREGPVTARERQFQAPPGLLCQVCQTASSVPMPKTSRRPSLFCADERLPFRLPDSVFQPL